MKLNLCGTVRLYEFLLIVVCLAFTGCGGKTAPVNGKVQFKGGGDVSALADYGINFESTEGKTSGTGEVQRDGTFKISTFGVDDGAIPGTYRVAITQPQAPDPDKPPAKSKIATKYGQFDTSGLTVEIKPGRNDVTLEVEGGP